MFWIIGCCLLIICIILFLSFTHLSIAFNYTYIRSAQVLMISVYFYNIRLLRREMPLDDNEKINILELIEKVDELPNKFSDLFQKIQDLHYISTAILKKTEIKHFKWDTYIGTGEASTTGIAIAGGWTVKGVLIGIISEQSTFACKPNLTIIPHFQERIIQSEIDCILSIKMGQTIYTFMKALRKHLPKRK